MVDWLGGNYNLCNAARGVRESLCYDLNEWMLLAKGTT